MTNPSRLSAVLRLRCPRCRTGRVFDGVISMRETCPDCGLRFEREPGYFFGAMYFSYAMAVVIISIFAVIGHFAFPDWPAHVVFLASWGAFLLFVPWVFRYSRVMWMHLDQSFDPQG